MWNNRVFLKWDKKLSEYVNMNIIINASKYIIVHIFFIFLKTQDCHICQTIKMELSGLGWDILTPIQIWTLNGAQP